MTKSAFEKYVDAHSAYKRAAGRLIVETTESYGDIGVDLLDIIQRDTNTPALNLVTFCGVSRGRVKLALHVLRTNGHIV